MPTARNIPLMNTGLYITVTPHAVLHLKYDYVQGELAQSNSKQSNLAELSSAKAAPFEQLKRQIAEGRLNIKVQRDAPARHVLLYGQLFRRTLYLRRSRLSRSGVLVVIRQNKPASMGSCAE